MENQTQPQTNNDTVALETKKEWIKPELTEMNINNNPGPGFDSGEQAGPLGS